MATGYHAARVANVQPGDSVIVLGDGAVGLSAIIAAKLRGAKQIISTSRHADREALAHEFGATDNVAERDEEGIKKLLDVMLMQYLNVLVASYLCNYCWWFIDHLCATSNCFIHESA